MTHIYERLMTHIYEFHVGESVVIRSWEQLFTGTVVKCKHSLFGERYLIQHGQTWNGRDSWTVAKWYPGRRLYHRAKDTI